MFFDFDLCTFSFLKALDMIFFLNGSMFMEDCYKGLLKIGEINSIIFNFYSLTQSFPMHPFFTPWKHQKTVRFSDVFKG